MRNTWNIRSSSDRFNPLLIDLRGRTFNRLTVVAFGKHNKYGHALWKVRCVCGQERFVVGSRLKSGGTKSCGCLRGCTTVHGGSGTKEYRAWRHIKSRCLNENIHNFHRYGGRGITVCNRWINSFKNFISDMGKAPAGTSIERINNALGYSPGNCRWATIKEQSNNRRSNRLIQFQGKNKTLAQWCNDLNLNYQMVFARLSSGWPVERALTTLRINPKDKHLYQLKPKASSLESG